MIIDGHDATLWCSENGGKWSARGVLQALKVGAPLAIAWAVAYFLIGRFLPGVPHRG